MKPEADPALTPDPHYSTTPLLPCCLHVPQACGGTHLGDGEVGLPSCQLAGYVLNEGSSMLSNYRPQNTGTSGVRSAGTLVEAEDYTHMPKPPTGQLGKVVNTLNQGRHFFSLHFSKAIEM